MGSLGGPICMAFMVAMIASYLPGLHTRFFRLQFNLSERSFP
uniref:Uncharacterized protein n=1 Tax=Arundo donax TaxID=35708 RepID=A0A0A8Y4N5_ARUDO